MRTRVVVTTILIATIGCRRSPENAPAAARGRSAIAALGCGACHTIPGVFGAMSLAAPPLDGIATRQVLAGRLPNTRDNMMRWIIDPPAIEPGVAMPPLLNADTNVVRDIVAYLYTLK